MLYIFWSILKTYVMKLKILAFLFSLVLISCSKDDDDGGGGNPCTTADVRIVNNSSNPYYLYVNGSYNSSMQGNTFTDLTLNEGSYNFKVEQISGFLFYPTIKEWSINLVGCQDRTLTFP